MIIRKKFYLDSLLRLKGNIKDEKQKSIKAGRKSLNGHLWHKRRERLKEELQNMRERPSLRGESFL